MSKREHETSETSDNKRPCHETKERDMDKNNGPFYWEMPGTIASGRNKGQPKPTDKVARNHLLPGQRIFCSDSSTGGKLYWTLTWGAHR